MTEQQLIDALSSGRLSKVRIDKLVDEMELHPELTLTLLNRVFEEDKKDEFNASWVLDHLLRKKLVYILPHFDEFTSGLAELKSESCIRPMAHICQMVTEAYFEKKNSTFIENIKANQLERIMTACFDWLIGQHKIAAKVFSMTSLYYLGMQFDWVHPELKLVLEETIAKGSSGYKNRASKTLDKLVALGH
ncbi:adenylosuccinate lyase [Flagellimonas sp.]|uniref:adenylosuccinate lyase n=1 Tax=Flagellimonas sp. TaxID=2058762 RepID=UPI003F4A6F9F